MGEEEDGSTQWGRQSFPAALERGQRLPTTGATAQGGGGLIPTFTGIPGDRIDPGTLPTKQASYTRWSGKKGGWEGHRCLVPEATTSPALAYSVYLLGFFGLQGAENLQRWLI